MANWRIKGRKKTATDSSAIRMLAIGAAAFASGACSLKPNSSGTMAHVRVEMPEAQALTRNQAALNGLPLLRSHNGSMKNRPAASSKRNVRSSSTAGSDPDEPNPSSLATFACFVINITGSGVGSNYPATKKLQSCDGVAPATVPGLIVGSTSLAGGTLEFDLPTGPDRTFQVVAFRSDSGYCPTVAELTTDNGNDQNHTGHPYEIGRTTQSIASTTSTITIGISFDPNKPKRVFCDDGDQIADVTLPPPDLVHATFLPDQVANATSLGTFAGMPQSPLNSLQLDWTAVAGVDRYLIACVDETNQLSLPTYTVNTAQAGTVANPFVYPNLTTGHAYTCRINSVKGDSRSAAARATAAPVAVKPVVVPTFMTGNGKGPRWDDYVGTPAAGTEPDYSQPLSGGNASVCQLDSDEANCLHAGERRQVTLYNEPLTANCSNVQLVDGMADLQGLISGNFEWGCTEAVVAGNTGAKSITFFTHGLLRGIGATAGKGLANLLTFTPTTGMGPAWKLGSVSVTGAITASSTPTAWWENSVAQLPDSASSAITLGPGIGNIYVTGHTAITHGYRIAADGTAIVIMPGAQLTWNSTSTNCTIDPSSGTTLDTSATICANANSHLWIEGQFGRVGNIPGAREGVYLYAVRHSRLHNLWVSDITGTPGYGSIVLQGSAANPARGNRLEFVTATNGAKDGIVLSYAPGTRASRLRISKHLSAGLRTDNASNVPDRQVIDSVQSMSNQFGIVVGSDQNHFSNLFVSNNDHGISLLPFNGNSFDRVVASSNSFDGFLLTPGASFNRIVGLTTVKNGGSGIWISGSNQNILLNVLSVANATYGIELTSPSTGGRLNGETIINATLLGNGVSGFTFDERTATDTAPTGHRFSGAWIFGGNSHDCDVSHLNAYTSGVAGSPCAPNGDSDFTPTILGAPSLNQMFVAYLPTLDSSTDPNLQANESGVTSGMLSDPRDWFSFANGFRALGLYDAIAAMGSYGQGAWNSSITTQSPRIWDWSLANNTSNFLLNAKISPADGGLAAPFFAPSSTQCPSTAMGSAQVGRSAVFPFNASLPDASHAVQAVRSDNPALPCSDSTAACRFDPNLTPCVSGYCAMPFHLNALNLTSSGSALCQAGGDCLFMPNVGAYQGHPDGATLPEQIPDGSCPLGSTDPRIALSSLRGFRSNGRPAAAGN